MCMDTREVERLHDQLRSSRDSGTRFTLGVTTCAHGDLDQCHCHDLDDRNHSRDKRLISAYSVRSTVYMTEKHGGWFLHGRRIL